MKINTADRAHAREVLNCLTFGQIIYTQVYSVSKSGMSRTIKFYTIERGELIHLSWSIATVMGYKHDNRSNGVRVGGGGMDMAWMAVNELGAKLGITLEQRAI